MNVCLKGNSPHPGPLPGGEGEKNKSRGRRDKAEGRTKETKSIQHVWVTSTNNLTRSDTIGLIIILVFLFTISVIAAFAFLGWRFWQTTKTGKVFSMTDTNDVLRIIRGK